MQRKTLFLFVLILMSFGFNAHRFYFAFAEMEYHEAEKKLEVTLIFSAHDLEEMWLKKNVIQNHFEETPHLKANLDQMNKALLQDFSVKSEGKRADFKLLDFELTRTGMIQFYLLAEHVEISTEFHVTFKSLMQTFQEQQNKLTYINAGKKQTAVFIPNKTTQKLKK